MPPATPAEIESIVRANIASLPHGQKTAAVRALAAQSGKSVQTVYRTLADVTVRPPRRRRSDAGAHTLPLAEAQVISLWVLEGVNKKGKRIRSLEQALRELRYAGKVRAEGVHPDTGEVTPLSVSAVSKALKAYGLHPDQILRPAPAAAMASLHPLHLVEIDASICVLHYLSNVTGLQVMEHAQFYKNKPKNLERIAAERVWRYLVVDHYSGAIFCHYVLGAESGANLVEAFIQFCTPRKFVGSDGAVETDPFHGVPFNAYVDQGSANTGAQFKSLARRIGMTVTAHAPGNARATGAVEKPQDIWEKNFESALGCEPIASLEELNAAAALYARWFNATRRHTRHGQTRTDMFLTIAPEQQRLAPTPELLRRLATHKPEERKVEAWPGASIRFEGKVYDVSSVPGVMVGEKLHVTYSPWQAGHVSIVQHDAQGNELLLAVPEIAFNEAGFPSNAAVFGEEFKRPADTVLQTNAKLLERLAMGEDTDTAAAAARKGRRLALGGEVRPLAEAREAKLPTPLLRPGVDLPLQTRVELPAVLLPHFAAAQRLGAEHGVHMTPELVATLKALHADGVPEGELPAIAARLTVRAGLRVVGGGQ